MSLALSERPCYTTPVAERHHRRAVIAPLVVILLVLLLPFSAAFEDWGLPMDEGSLLVYPEAVQNGALPYRDFETFYGPANPFLLAAVYAIFGTNIVVERAIGFLYRLVILLAIYGLARRWGNVLAAGCLALAGFLLVSGGVVAYAWYGAIAAGFSSLWLLAESESRARCFFGGLLGGLALLFRADLAPAVIASALPLFLLMTRERKLAYVGGAVAGLLPYIGLIFAAGAREMFNNLFLYPVIYSSPARQLPFASAHNHVLFLLIAHGAASLINVVAGALALRAEPRNGRGRLLLAVGLFGLCVTHQGVQRIDLLHVLFVAFTALPFVPISLATLAARGRTIVPRRAEAFVAVLTVAVALQTLVPERTAQFHQNFRKALSGQPGNVFSVELNGRSFPVGSIDDVRSLGRLLSALERQAVAGERLFVGPGDLRRTNNADTFLYHLFPQLRPATYFLEMNPLSANRPNSRLAADVASADWLVLNTEWDHWNEKNASSRFGSDEANAVVREQFVLEGEYGTYRLFRRKGAGSRA